MDKTHAHPAVIIDLGSRRKKAIRDLKNGTGKLMLEVEQAIDHARASLPDEDKNKPIIPVVVIYRRKRRRSGGGSMLPCNPLNLLRC